MHWNGSKGFSLLELMIVVAIIGIVAAIAYPSYQTSVRTGHRADAVSTLMALQLAQERSRALNITYLNNLNNAAFNRIVTPAGGNFVSPAGWYLITLDQVTAGTFRFTATPQGDQVNDVACGAFQLTQNGPAPRAGQPANCWTP